MSASVLLVLISLSWRSLRAANVCSFSPALLYGLLYKSVGISKRLSVHDNIRCHTFGTAPLSNRNRVQEDSRQRFSLPFSLLA
jgi:hypothetical protein